MEHMAHTITNEGEQMNNNKVLLQGVIVDDPRYSHEMFGEGFYEMTMSVQRLSNVVDLIPITLSERLIADQKIIRGKELIVRGQFRSYNKLVGNRSKLMLTVFVREVLDELPVENPNVIELMGYVCKAPIYRTTPFNREITDILVAVNRAYNKSDYIPAIAWGRNARFAEGLRVGDRVFLSGRIQSREYQKRLDDGTVETRVAYEISVNRIGDTEIESVLGDTLSETFLSDNDNVIDEILGG
ncbi:MAG: single-stranded DNA-binding protein [Firmicutes bacterium]|nr:single-stranded DNA-binding protein [Bacillota bacterium]